MIRKLTSAFAAIGILGTWGFMAYFGLPKGFPWFPKPIGVVGPKSNAGWIAF